MKKLFSLVILMLFSSLASAVYGIDPILNILSPLNGYEYSSSEILINIEAWSGENGECSAYECEGYGIEECLDDPEGFGNCFFDYEGECDTYELWDIEDYDQCISESGYWNEYCMNIVDCWEYEGNQDACEVEPSCFWNDWDYCESVVNCWDYEGNQDACDAEPSCEWEGNCNYPQCGNIMNYDECIEISNDHQSCVWYGDNESGSCGNEFECWMMNETICDAAEPHCEWDGWNCGYGVNCWDFQNESDCSTDNQYNLTCYWASDGEDNYCTDQLECDYFEEDEASCVYNPYEIECFWKYEEIEDIWYSVNDGEDISYFEEISYEFDAGDNTLIACANDDGSIICDNSEFSVISCLKGDLNEDVEINVLDIVILVEVILEGTELNGLQLCAADYNSDGEINVQDIVELVDYIINSRSRVTTASILKQINTVLSKNKKMGREIISSLR